MEVMCRTVSDITGGDQFIVVVEQTGVESGTGRVNFECLNNNCSRHKLGFGKWVRLLNEGKGGKEESVSMCAKE